MPCLLELSVDTEDVIDRFSITWSDQERFASLTGDWNPIHTNHDFARRSSFGAVVVHGMNTVLTALERYYRNVRMGEALAQPASIAVQFPRPVFISDDLRLVRVNQSRTKLRLAIRAGNTDLVKLTIVWGSADASSHISHHASLPTENRQAPAKRHPADRSMRDGEGLTLSMPLAVDAKAMIEAYPGLVQWLGEKPVAGIALLSTIVGMEWPGLRSLFVEAKIQLHAPLPSEADTITTRVLSADAERGLTTAETHCPGIVAETTAFFRPAPVVQPAFNDLAKRVGVAPFEGWSALVVGGSRGLGEIAAKMMAAGSADVVVTYRSGLKQAEAVAADIRLGGGQCKLVPYDVEAQALVLPPLAKADQPVLLFYSASPHIFRRRTDAYSRAWLDEFISVYVDGFINVLQAVKDWTKGPISVVYPSSEALEQPMAQLVEYAAAKAAGEAACRSLVAGDSRITVELPRLPRLLTDQTNSVIHVDTADPVDVLLPILIRLMQTQP
jgi:acyl dehydratase